MEGLFKRLIWFVRERTELFLLHPEESFREQSLGNEKLQAKVHIIEEDRLSLCQMLVERNSCVWAPETEVLEVQSQKVLNGLFGVGKGTFLPNGGGEVLRLIMNLQPSKCSFTTGSRSNRGSSFNYTVFVVAGEWQGADSNISV